MLLYCIEKQLEICNFYNLIITPSSLEAHLQKCLTSSLVKCSLVLWINCLAKRDGDPTLIMCPSVKNHEEPKTRGNASNNQLLKKKTSNYFWTVGIFWLQVLMVHMFFGFLDFLLKSIVGRSWPTSQLSCVHQVN